MDVRLTPASDDHAAALAALITRNNRADGIPMVVVVDEVHDMLHGRHIDPALDTRVVLLGDRLVGYMFVHHRPSGSREERVYLDGGVDPEFRRRGIGSTLVAWAMDRARARMAPIDNDLPRVIRADSYDWREDQIALHRRFGLRPERYFHEMLRPLVAIPERPPVSGIAIIPWKAEHTEAARRLHNEAFSDHWGSIPADAESWEQWLGDYGCRVDLSFIAMDGASVVGLALNAHYPDDAAVHGRLEGWVDRLCTAQSHRGRGIASGLLVASMQAFAAAGFDHAALGVDSASPTGADRLYADLGFVVDRRTVVSQLRYQPD